MIVLKLVNKQKLDQEYAKLKNYKPNVIGLNLKTGNKTIGVIIQYFKLFFHESF
jgi:DNA-binding LacI/PurR family transcriptional regulator